jgi:hypothetical protein
MSRGGCPTNRISGTSNKLAVSVTYCVIRLNGASDGEVASEIQQTICDVVQERAFDY